MHDNKNVTQTNNNMRENAVTQSTTTNTTNEPAGRKILRKVKIDPEKLKSIGLNRKIAQALDNKYQNANSTNDQNTVANETAIVTTPAVEGISTMAEAEAEAKTVVVAEAEVEAVKTSVAPISTTTSTTTTTVDATPTRTTTVILDKKEDYHLLKCEYIFIVVQNVENLFPPKMY